MVLHRTMAQPPTELYGMVFAFLKEFGLPKSAKAFAKEAGKEKAETLSTTSLFDLYKKHTASAFP